MRRALIIKMIHSKCSFYVAIFNFHFSFLSWPLVSTFVSIWFPWLPSANTIIFQVTKSHSLSATVNNSTQTFFQSLHLFPSEMFLITSSHDHIPFRLMLCVCPNLSLNSQGWSQSINQANLLSTGSDHL